MFSLAIWKTCSPLTFATVFNSGTAFKKALYAHRCCGVTDHGGAARTGAGDRATGRQNHDVGQLTGALRVRDCKTEEQHEEHAHCRQYVIMHSKLPHLDLPFLESLVDAPQFAQRYMILQPRPPV